MSPDAPATGTQPAPLIQELAPSGWLVAGSEDHLHEFEWLGEIHRNAADAVADLEQIRRSLNPAVEGGTWQLYALYPCPDPMEDDE